MESNNTSTVATDILSPETRLVHNIGATTIAVVGTFANLSTIFAIVKTKLYKQAAILFILNLIILNFVSCAFCLSYIAGLSFVVGENLSNGVNNVLCKTVGYLTYCIMGAEILGLILISLNRYILVVHFNKYHQIFNLRRNICIMLIVSWIIYPVIFLLPAIEVWGKFEYDPQRFFCHPLTGDGFTQFAIIFTLTLSIPTSGYCYVAMVYRVWSSRTKVEAIRNTNQSSNASTMNRKSSRRQKQDMQLVFTIILILTTFALLYIPFLVVSLLDMKSSSYKPTVHIVSLYIGWTHCVVNPLIYSLMNSHIKNSYNCCPTGKLH